MNKTAFYAVLIALILGIVYVLATSDKPPATGITQTPEQYIQRLEQSKAAKRESSQDERLRQRSDPDEPNNRAQGEDQR